MRAQTVRSQSPLKLSGTAIQAIFFDLDGTLLDSAPDLVAAVEYLREQLGAAPVDARAVTRVVSRGGRAMLRQGFPDADEARVDWLLPRFLERYAQAIAVHTQVYPGVAQMLKVLEQRSIVWGIVTNKPGNLARALVAEIALGTKCAALVSGDCLARRKPDPAPLLHAAQLAHVDAAHSVYVGDDARDIEAGSAAGMLTVAAGWGYLNGEDPNHWNADVVVHSCADLLAALDLA